MNDDVRMFRDSVRQFVAREFVPHQARWREQRGPDADAWSRAGRAGLLLADVPEDYGGGGGTFAHEAVVIEELARAGVHFGAAIQSTVAHYILAYGTEEQKRAWLPRLARGERVAAIAMTEPRAGSDLQAIKTLARRDGEHYVVNGSKTFITNAAHADLVCLAVRRPIPRLTGMRAISLLIVETKDLPGYRVGRPLEKIGMHGQDTCEMFFDEVRVPAANLLGAVGGQGLRADDGALPYERLQIAVGAVASAEQARRLTTRYVKERKAFGKPLFDLQNTRFKLAECRRQSAHRPRLRRPLHRAPRRRASSTRRAPRWPSTGSPRCSARSIDECLQLHGGYGYMTEYPIARMWADSRVQRIYAGSNEIMKELIAWSL